MIYNKTMKIKPVYAGGEAFIASKEVEVEITVETLRTGYIGKPPCGDCSID